MSKGRILIVLTSHDRLGETEKPTGFHYEEMTTPYKLFTEAGYEVELASIEGGDPPHDPGSLKEEMDKNPPSVCWFLGQDEAKEKLRNTRPVKELTADDYDAVYLPGGHGTMWDFPGNTALHELIGEMYRDGKPVAAVCHGIAGFIGAEDKMSQPIVKGKRVNCFTNAEEQEVGLDDTVPFLLETAMRELGAEFESSGIFQKHVTVDENLITGQNPASAEGVANAVIERLKDSRKQAA